MADNQYQDYNNVMNNEQYAQDVQQAGYDNQAYDGQYVDNQNYDYGQAYDNNGNYDNSQPFDAQQYQEQAYDNSQNAFYTQNNVQPLDATQMVQQTNVSDSNAIVIIPGQNGVPANISQKGIDDLTRLERLRKNGVIAEEVYLSMRQKIFSLFAF